MSKEIKEVVYIIAALAGFYWRYVWAALRCYSDIGCYEFGWADVLTSVLFIVIAWAYPAVRDIIRKAVKR